MKTMMEDLHQKFLIEISHVIIIVVSRMSFIDQKFMNHIISLISNEKVVIFVHNFSKISTLVDIEKVIECDIRNNEFNLIERQIAKSKLNEPKHSIFIHEKNPNIRHCILANKYSDAGEFYNPITLNYLRETINCTLISNFIELEKTFLNFLEKNKFLYYHDNLNIKLFI